MSKKKLTVKLFIIRNGFDRRHKCETGYDSFKEFLHTYSYMIGDFGLSHNFNVPEIHRNYDYNPFNPQKCLESLNQELKKEIF